MVFYHILFLNCNKLLEPEQHVAAYAGAFYTDNSKFNKIWYEKKPASVYKICGFIIHVENHLHVSVTFLLPSSGRCYTKDIIQRTSSQCANIKY